MYVLITAVRMMEAAPFREVYQRVSITERVRRRTLGRALLLTVGTLVACLAVGVAVDLGSAAVGVWYIWLFLTRRLWLEPLVAGLYRGGWTRAILWPFSAGDRDSCVAIVRSFSYIFPFIGILLILFDLNLRASPS